MAITFYTAQQSIGVVSHIVLEESGLDYELVAVDFVANQQTSCDYLKINPKARVPSLVLEQGVLTETPAILTYIAHLAPQSAIALPDDAYSYAQIQSFNSYLASTVHVAHAHKRRGSRWADEEAAIQAMSDYVPRSMGACMRLIEEELLSTPWVHGQTYSISDPYLYRISSWLAADGVDINQYPKIKTHYEAMRLRQAVQRVESYYN